MTEANLIRRAQEGEEHAFRLLMQQYQAVLSRTAFLATRDHAMGQEVVQETLTQVWLGLPRYGGGSFRAWLLTVLMNQARRQYRRMRVETVPLEEAAGLLDSTDGPEELALRAEVYQRLYRALGLLRVEQRDALVLRYYAGLTVPEVATVLGCREGTAKSRLSRGLARLQEALSGDQVPDTQELRHEGA